MLDGFICDTCGFTSSEEIGAGNAYYCPKYGNKMRRACHSGMFGGGDANTSSSVLAWDIVYFILVGGLSFGVMNYISYWTDDFVDLLLFFIWLVLFIASFVFFHKKISGSVSNKAIKSRQNTKHVNSRIQNYNSNASQFCTNCGNKLEKDVEFCSNCGEKIE